jgi:hypothetical protein
MDNRHTLAPEPAESGATDETIMQIAGHVSRQMLSRYAHIRAEAKRKALEEVERKRSMAKKRLAVVPESSRVSATSPVA